jgi:hypothetical protein
MKTIEQIQEVVALCSFKDYKFSATIDGRGEIYLQGSYIEKDTVSGKLETQMTRRWLLSPLMTKSEIVQTVFKCALTSMEHRTREWFFYRCRPVFGPHFNVDVLHDMCEHSKSFDTRESI